MTIEEVKEATAETREKIRVRIRMIKEDRGWTTKDLMAITGDKVSTMKNKLGGSNLFTLNDVILIAKMSGKSYDYIFGRSDS